MIDIAGWIGSILLAVCAVPQAWLSWRQGHSNGLSALLLLLWGVGEAFTLVYTVAQADYPLVVNYTCNLILIAVIARYKVWPRREKAAS